MLGGLSTLLTCNKVFAQSELTNQALQALKGGYRQRLSQLLEQGHLPYIDIESSCNSSRINAAEIVAQMDALHIGLMAMSSNINGNQYQRGIRFDNLPKQLASSYPQYFLPVGNGGQQPLLTEVPEEFLAAQLEAARGGEIGLFGEFEFRHYPSPREFKRGEEDRDSQIPIDGPIGHTLFSMSEKTGISFQLHYEIEDGLLPPLEVMLAKYPKAKVIWCHVGQVRYIERASNYGPKYLESLIGRFPNLYFDTAFGDANSVYPISKQRHSRVWEVSGDLKPEWRDLFIRYPTRFLSALDLGGDRLDRIEDKDAKHRHFLKQLPEATQHQIAYRNTWRLLYGEEFS